MRFRFHEFFFSFFLGTSTIKKIPYGRWFLHRRSLGHDIDQIIIALFRNCFEIWPQRPSKGQLFNDLHFFQLFSISRRSKKYFFFLITVLQVNRFVGESMLIMASVLHLGQSGLVREFIFMIFLEIFQFHEKKFIIFLAN